MTMPGVPFVSVIIPAKNEALYLANVLVAVHTSIYECGCKCEVILVDNGSTDSTKEIARAYDCRIIEDSSASIAKLRNIGARKSSGKIIAFLDADCIVDKDWIRFCKERLLDEKIGIVGTCAIPDLANATWVEDGWYKLISGVERADFPKWIGSSNMFIRRDVFFNIGGFDERLETAEDVSFCYKMRENSFKICLEKRVSTLHLRESKTLYDLIKREIWRGKSSLRHFLNSKYKNEDALSLIIPILYNFLLGSTFVLYRYSPLMAAVAAGLLLFIPVIMIIKKRALISCTKDLIKVYLVALYYLIARSIALLFELLIIVYRYAATIQGDEKVFFQSGKDAHEKS